MKPKKITTKILERLGEEAKDTDLIYPDERFPPSMYYRFLRLLVEEMKPKLSVELGVSGGGGSLHLAAGWWRGTVIGVDHQEDHVKRIKYIEKNYNNFIFLLEDSIGAASILNEVWGGIDILFIDTDHTYQRTIDEFNAYKDYLSKGAVIILDDLFRPGMEKAWDELPGKKIRLDHLHDGQFPEGGGFGCTIL